jgi:predicted PurR-regulated permease PerM
METPLPSRDLTRTLLAVLFIGVLIAANFWILKPFLPSLVWAVIIVVATWPILIRLQARLGGKRGAAVAIMTLGLLALLIAPILLAVSTILDNVERAKELLKALETQGLPSLPAWVPALPLIGSRIAET